jgi:hypothetical protein
MSDSSEIKRYSSPHSDDYLAVKEEILGNTYVIILCPKRKHSRSILIYANTKDGRDDGFPAKMHGKLGCDYDTIHRTEVSNEPISSAIAKAVTEAVRKLERALREERSKEEAIMAGVETSREVLEGEVNE